MRCSCRRTLSAYSAFRCDWGQDFTHSGNERDCFHQAIVTNGYWRRMGGDNALDGRTIKLDYQTYIIVGVLAPRAGLEDIDALGQPSILTPIGCDPARDPEDRGDSSFQRIARLKPGVSMSAAPEDLERTQKNLSRAFPRDYPPTFVPTMMPLTSRTRSMGWGVQSAGRRTRPQSADQHVKLPEFVKNHAAHTYRAVHRRNRDRACVDRIGESGSGVVYRKTLRLRFGI
jgi:hypothetical protein